MMNDPYFVRIFALHPVTSWFVASCASLKHLHISLDIENGCACHEEKLVPNNRSSRLTDINVNSIYPLRFGSSILNYKGYVNITAIFRWHCWDAEWKIQNTKGRSDISHFGRFCCLWIYPVLIYPVPPARVISWTGVRPILAQRLV